MRTRVAWHGRSRARLLGGGVAAALLAATVVGGTPASGKQSSERSNGARGQEVSVPVRGPLDADQEVADLVAEGMKTDDAERFIADQLRFSDLTAHLRDTYPLLFVSSIVHREPISFEVRMTRVPELLDASVFGLTSPLNIVEVPGVPEAELRDTQMLVYEHLMNSNQAEGTATYIDSEANLLRVFLPATLSLDEDGRLQELLTKPRVAVEFNSSSGRTYEPLIVRGGARTKKANGQNLCTTGFSVVSSIGVTGISSAGHCEEATKYVHPGDGSTVYLNLQGYKEGNLGDLAWYTTSEFERADFFVRSSERRNVTEVARGNSYDKNEQIWYYGRTSGYGSAWVYSPYATCAYLATMVFMETAPQAGGDSGGPWFVGGQANGITSGQCRPDEDKPWRAMFSRVAQLEDAFDVTVRIR